jgi:hypothetical protein
MSITNSVVAIYDTHEQAEKAIKELQEAGVDMKSLSIAAKGYAYGRACGRLLQRRRPHEALGQSRSVLGRILGSSVRIGACSSYPD